MGTRWTRIAGAVLALAMLAPPALASDLLGGTAQDPQRAVLDLSGALDLTTTLSALSLPAQASGIGPGSHLLIEMDGGLFGCTASYVWESGGSLLLGAAGHCFLPGDATATHGPGADHDPADTTVSVCVADCSFGGQLGFVITGELVELGAVRYARQASAGGDQIGFDFGVVEIPSSLHGLVRTSMPVFGGPDQAGTLSPGDQVCHYGAGVAVGEIWPTMGRTGVGLLADDEAWFAATAAAPGDSGSALQTCALGADGITGVAAVGTLTHLSSLGVAGTTNARSVALARDDARLSISLVLGSGAGDPGSGGDDAEDPADPTDPSEPGPAPGNGRGNGGGNGGGRPAG
jgi:hypothetical protein